MIIFKPIISTESLFNQKKNNLFIICLVKHIYTTYSKTNNQIILIILFLKTGVSFYYNLQMLELLSIIFCQCDHLVTRL